MIAPSGPKYAAEVSGLLGCRIVLWGFAPAAALATLGIGETGGGAAWSRVVLWRCVRGGVVGGAGEEYFWIAGCEPPKCCQVGRFGVGQWPLSSRGVRRGVVVLAARAAFSGFLMGPVVVGWMARPSVARFGQGVHLRASPFGSWGARSGFRRVVFWGAGRGVGCVFAGGTGPPADPPAGVLFSPWAAAGRWGGFGKRRWPLSAALVFDAEGVRWKRGWGISFFSPQIVPLASCVLFIGFPRGPRCPSEKRALGTRGAVFSWERLSAVALSSRYVEGAGL